MPRSKRSRRNTINGNRPRTQMPSDADQRANIERLDALKKTKHDQDIIDRLRLDRAERLARSTPTALERDIIEEARKRPKTWDEINSNAAGGTDR
jgi:hypothetical protein